jgi:quercetin dioxygenase-like cupin family protein
MIRQTRPLALGKVLKRVEVEGFVLTETVRPPSLVLPKHFHEYTNIALVLEGTFMETVGQHPQECGPLSVILRPAGEVHSNQYGRSAARYLIMEVKPQRLEMIRQVSNWIMQCRRWRIQTGPW